MAKVLFLSIHYRPEPNFIVADVAESYARMGHDVMVLTAYPNYPYGHFYDKRWHLIPTRTLVNGVTVWRLPHLPDHSFSKLRRFISYMSFSILAMVLAPLLARRPQLVLVYQTPFTVALAAIPIRWLTRCRTVFVYADLWPESFQAARVSTSNRAYQLLYAYSRWINQFCDTLVASTRGMVERYTKDGVDPRRIRYIPLWVDASKAAPPPTLAEVKRSLVYAGNLGPAQNLRPLLAGFKIVEEAQSDLWFDIYGTGAEEVELKRYADELRLQRVRFHGRIAPEQALEYSRSALAQVVHLAKSPLFRMTIPSKLGFCLAAGRPILAGLEGEANDLAAESGAAFRFECESPESFAAAVQRLAKSSEGELTAMGQHGRLFFEQKLKFERLVEQYSHILDEVGLQSPAQKDSERGYHQ